jgi:type I restriction enzyme S subunit
MNRKIKLSEIVKIAGRVGWKGYTVDDLREEGPWVIGANDITTDNRLDLSKAKHISREKYEESPEIKIELNDILIVKVGSTIGKVAIINRDIGEACINPNSVILKNCKINSSYLYYFLISSAGQAFLRNNSSASAQSALNQLTLKEMLIDLVDEQSQENISALLNNLNSKIELNNRINAELEAMAKTLYDYWFVQFEFPIEAAIAAKMGDPNLIGQPYKTSGGKMVWNEELRREIPEGWEVKKVREIATTGSGSTPLKSNKEYYLNGNIPWINSGELNDPFIIEAKKYITQLGMNSSSTKLFKRGTLLIAMYGATAGKVSILDIEACTNQAICSINLHNSSHRNYLKLVLDDLYEYLINLSTGSARDNLSQDKIKELVVLMPNGLSIKKFDKIIEPMYAKILNAYRENQKLTELRDWLLPMLMNGQVKVSER